MNRNLNRRIHPIAEADGLSPKKPRNAVKKILYFFLSFLWVVGAIGSLGYILWMKEWVVAIGLVIVIVPSVPKIKEWVKFILSDE